MTVSELIKELEEHDDNLRVLVQCRDIGGYYEGDFDDELILKEQDGKLVL